jgi:hypothetical protein
MGNMDSYDLAEDRDRLRAFVNRRMTLPALTAGNFLTR